MEAHDGTRLMSELRYRAQVRPEQTFVMTYDEHTNHPRYGPITMRIWRAIGNDSGLKTQLTADLLKKHEPNVALWPGDVIQYIDGFGNIIEEEFGGVDKQLEEYIRSWTSTPTE